MDKVIAVGGNRSVGVTYYCEIGVRTSFEAFHKWQDAPGEVAFLRNWHRHVFNVLVEVPTVHADRQLEFFIIKRELDLWITETYKGKYFEDSCETVAHNIGSFVLDKWSVPQCTVLVQEDGENYGKVVMRRGVPC